MGKVTVDRIRPVYPTPAGLITSVAADGKPNIITLGEVFNVSLHSPPIVGLAIRKATYSHGLIAACKEFVVNLPTVSILRQADFCGSCSGRNVDKFAETGLTPLPARHVRPPLIAECPINIECRLTSLQDIGGDHDLFLGEVLEVHADESVLDEHGKVSPDKLSTFVFMYNFGHLGEYWSVAGKLEDAYFTRRPR